MNFHETVNETLLSAYLDGEVTIQERALVEQWLNDSAVHRETLDDLKLLRTDMQQLPKHQLGEGFVRSVVETAARQQPVPESERVDRANVQEPVNAGRTPSWVRERWQGLVLALTTAAALVLVVRLLVPGPMGDLASQNDPVGTPPSEVADSNSVTGQQDPAIANNPSEVLPGSKVSQDPQDTVNPGSVEKVAGTPGAVEEPATTPTETNSVPGTDNPVVSRPLPKVPGLEQLVGNRLLFVIEVAVTPEGVKNRTLDQVLMNHGIVYDRAIEVDRPLEQSILKSRYLKGVVSKRDNKNDNYMDVDLIYVVCNGQQVDDTTAALSDFPREITGHRFNLALLPHELQTFKSLNETVASQWNQSGKDKKQAARVFKARAGRLLTDLVLLSRIARPLGTTAVLKVDPVPLPDKAPVIPKPGQPALVPGDSGATMQCEVLFVVRHLPPAQDR
jgi:negative regulator of sigma E activity